MGDIMEISIKGLKHSAFASHETHCFEATVYVNGTRSFMVENDGQGGSNNYYPLKGKTAMHTNTTVKKINDYLSTLPEKQFDDFSVQADLDCIIGDLVNDTLTLKRVKPQLKKKVLGYSPSKNGVYEWKCQFTPANVKQIKKQHPDILIFNDMTDADILKYYR